MKEANKRKTQLIAIALYGPLSANSVEKSVWMRSRYQKGECHVLHITDTVTSEL